MVMLPLTATEEEPPADMDVENDVLLPMPMRWEVVPNVRVIEAGPMKPCIILPEDLPDE